MKSLVAILALLAAAFSAAAQQTPDPGDFYFCADFYRWFGGQLKEDTKLKQQMAMSASMFDAGSVALTEGVRSSALTYAATQKMKATVNQGKQDNLTLGELFKVVDTDCWSKQQQHASTILRKMSDVSRAQQPFFQLNLPSGQVSPEDIASRVDTLRMRPGVQIGDQKEVFIYSFERSLGDKTETVHHIVTKETNPAHPAIIFIQVVRDGKDRPPVKNFGGSFAGSKSEYENLYYAYVLSNRGN
jgi:hypothetical protein